jgi:DNA-binding response OmpR family regulator
MSFIDRLRTLLYRSEETDARQQETPNSTGWVGVPDPESAAPAYVGLRALTIDDSMTVVVMLRKILQKEGFQTLEALNAEDGIELARMHRPDVIFLDIVLPKMDGFNALRLLRKDPITQDVPIIMMSGNEQAAEQFYAQRIGANDFMKKPFSQHEVYSRIDRLIESGYLSRGVPRTLVAAVR